MKVRKLGNSSVTYDVGLFREDANIAAAEGYFVHVHVDRETRRPVPMTGGVRAILEHLAQG